MAPQPTVSLTIAPCLMPQTNQAWQAHEALVHSSGTTSKCRCANKCASMLQCVDSNAGMIHSADQRCKMLRLLPTPFVLTQCSKHQRTSTSKLSTASCDPVRQVGTRQELCTGLLLRTCFSCVAERVTVNCAAAGSPTKPQWQEIAVPSTSCAKVRSP